jgi:hypothetical protein
VQVVREGVICRSVQCVRLDSQLILPLHWLGNDIHSAWDLLLSNRNKRGSALDGDRAAGWVGEGEVQEGAVRGEEGEAEFALAVYHEWHVLGKHINVMMSSQVHFESSRALYDRIISSI